MSSVIEDFAQRISEAAAHIHAATAALVLEVAGFDERGGWRGEGMRGCEQWLSIAAGFDERTSAEMLRVGHALAALPATRDAFSAGHLSFDKVRLLTPVATAEDEHIWLTVARDASAAQLGSICRAARRGRAAEDPATPQRQQAARRVAWWWRDEDGMLQLVASLPPEEGRIVISAFEAAEVRPLPARPGDDAEPEADPGPEVDHPHGARRADALVRVCEGWLAEAAAGAPAERAPRALTVHIDLETLAGLGSASAPAPGTPASLLGGRCHLEDGPALAVAAARRIGCDAEVVAVLERDGVPLRTGRMRRFPSHRMRRLLRERDGHCTYPGCLVPATDTEAHHIVHWVDGGPTTPSNLVSLCRFHHHRRHDGEFRIIAVSRRAARSGRFRFETAGGRLIGPPPPRPRPHSRARPAIVACPERRRRTRHRQHHRGGP